MSRAVIVTGAASGNGLEITRSFLANGDRVVAVDVAAEGLGRAWDAEVAERQGQLVTVAGSIAEEADVERIVRTAVERFGRVDVLVNNAGVLGGDEPHPLHETPMAEFDKVLGVNLRGTFMMCRAALPVMLAQGGGVIVNLGSIAGLRANKGRSAYSTSKGAILQLTRTITADYAHLGIRANTLCPGFVATPMTTWRLADEAALAASKAKIPQQELGTTRDVADAVMFLAGPQSRYMNGTELYLDGGRSAV